MDLEVEVRRTRGVAAVSVVPDDLAGFDPSIRAFVRFQMGVVVAVAVVAGDRHSVAAELVLLVRDEPARHGDDRHAERRQHVDALVVPSARSRLHPTSRRRRSRPSDTRCCRCSPAPLSMPGAALPSPPVPVRPPLDPPDAPPFGMTIAAGGSVVGYGFDRLAIDDLAVGRLARGRLAADRDRGHSSCRLAQPRIGLGPLGGFGRSPLIFQDLGSQRSLLFLQSLLHGLVLEPLLLDLAESDDLGLGFLLQRGEDVLLFLDRLTTGGQFGLLLFEIVTSLLVLIDSVGSVVRQHCDEYLGLHLILRGLHAGEQRDARSTAVDEATQRHALDVALQFLHGGRQLRLLDDELGHVVLQHLEFGLGGEERLGRCVRPIARRLDLGHRLFRCIFTRLRRRRRDRERTRDDSDQTGHDAGPQPRQPCRRYGPGRRCGSRARR